MTAYSTSTTPSSGARLPSSHGPEAEALLEEVRAASATLAALLAHGGHLGEEAAAGIRVAVAEVEAQVDRRELSVVIVGEAGSGKSTLLDALLGERLLGAASTPSRMVISVRRASECDYRARFSNGAAGRFAALVRDRIQQMDEQVREAETDCEVAERRRDAARAEVAAASEEVERTERAAAAASASLDAARRAASSVRAELETWTRQRDDLRLEATDRDGRLPSLVRRSPPWWALWVWLVRLLLLLVTVRARRALGALLDRHKQAEAKVPLLSFEAGHADERSAAAQTEHVEAAAALDQARLRASAARRAEDEIDALLAGLEREADLRRADLARAREENRRRFVADVRALSAGGPPGRELLDLDIEYPARLLPDDIILIDAPGATARDEADRDRAWRMIRERADGCVLVSELERAVSGATKSALQQLRDAVPHVILVLTKMDASVDEAVRAGYSDPADRIEQARRIGTRRFARELGREADTVLCVALSAEEALREADPSEPAPSRFDTAVGKLFLILRQEKALIVGTRSAGIVRRCIDGAAEAEERAEGSYRDLIAALEAERIPEPERFLADQTKAVEPAIASAAAAAVQSGHTALGEATRLVRVQCAQWIDGCASRDALRALVPRLSEEVGAGLLRVRDEVRTQVAARAERALVDVEAALFRALRERYGLLYEITRAPGTALALGDLMAGTLSPPAFAAGIDGAVRSHGRQRAGFGLGGAVAGAAAGSLILPGIGTAAGAVIGALATFARTLGALKRAAARLVDDRITELEQELATRIAASEPAVATAMHACLERSLDAAVTRFGRFIAEPIEEERATIEREHEKLSNLLALREHLAAHDRHLQTLIRAAAEASVGLCT